ncbi:MAG: hypothetical protein A2754_01720 [Candidatus Magasanikbacteria bacterium RIFCSPHIGHO2_01_FULL_47_8]|uniref:Glycosyltransferase subfamily 4-like N-terminal domain-containing protein n=1 Tax=Candidatus Magasanikbacteria bacterium RIFCSPHIGHO2_01_FULL_47_8 TaxID=1798673 RepID=A0A1F6ME57_9BACT|nr:MAG: hypothetical protein A2754_01720 [Candidatus Magasanikbacteria bacterium RIFCSPHIGHO2_01_FULL_47_8]
MKILQANKFFYERGGAEKVMFETIRGLRERGHEVSEFSMVSPKNFISNYAGYFIRELPELKSAPSLFAQWKIFSHLFRSSEVERKLKALVLAAKPEVAHLHNIYHQLSASTFVSLKKMKVPMVLTLHDVFPLCPNHSLLYGETMGEKYYKKKLYNCLRYKCIDNKFLPSLAGTLEAYYYRLKKIWDMVDLFICPSQFMKDKMIEYGFPGKKMRVIPNPFSLGAEQAPPLGNKVVYLGRIHYEKGIKIFMEAVKELSGYPALVAGSGPEDVWVNSYIAEHRLQNVDRRGWVSGPSWEAVMREAKVIVVPSLFFENCSLTILEALSHGRLVVAVDRGGNREMIIDGVTGFLAQPEDPTDLARAIKKAMELPAAEAAEMIQRAQALIAKNHNPEQYFKKLLNVYREVL